jgi:hypothetical protein
MMEHPATDSHNPIIVFDECSVGPAFDDLPIMLQSRQPSFTYLGFAPTPKGFRSLSDFRAQLARLPGLRSLDAVPRFGERGNAHRTRWDHAPQSDDPSSYP